MPGFPTFRANPCSRPAPNPLFARRATQGLTKRCQHGGPCLASVGPLASLETAAFPCQGFHHAPASPISLGNPSMPAIQPEPSPDIRTALKGAAALVGCLFAVVLMGYTRDRISGAGMAPVLLHLPCSLLAGPIVGTRRADIRQVGPPGLLKRLACFVERSLAAKVVETPEKDVTAGVWGPKPKTVSHSAIRNQIEPVSGAGLRRACGQADQARCSPQRQRLARHRRSVHSAA